MAVKPSSPASDLAELVTCSICLESFKDARALPCLHSYCKECLQSLVTPQGKITCPHCRLEVDVPNGDVSNLNSNFFVNNVLDVLNSSSDAAPTTDATPTSNAFLANDADATGTTNTTCCQDHPEKECELFCQNCSKLICYKCISNWGTCGQHLYESMDTVVKEYRKNVVDFLKEKEELLPSVIKHVAVLAEMKVAQSDNVLEVTKQISDTFAKHIESLKTRQGILFEQAFDMQWKNDNGLSSEVDRVQLEQAKLENTIEFCHNILAMDDPAHFLLTYIHIKDKVLQADSPELVSHVDVGKLCFQATESLLTDVISNYGNVVAYDRGRAAEEKPPRKERPPSKLKRLPTSDRPAEGLHHANEPGPYHPSPANEPNHVQPVVQRSRSEPGGVATAKPVTWKLYNKNMSSPKVTFEDNGFSVKTTSPRNVAIIGKPGFQRGKHSWNINIIGCRDGLSIGICVGRNGRGIVVTYDSNLTYFSTTVSVLVELDCDAKKVSVLPEGYQTPDVLGFHNPHNYEVHPYFFLPPSDQWPAQSNKYNKITIVNIDGVSVENNESCCIL